jgi:2-oxoglutarate ferredoxin oxidoreductase subunit beta
MGLVEKAVHVIGIGCCGLGGGYVDLDSVGCAHGRACAAATGIKRCEPDKLVFTYQGDGDLAAIGLAETMSAANRGENFSVIFVNNGTYGMTGGQMAPTTLVGQVTTTSPYGRDAELCGKPIRVAEMLATLEGAAYIERVSLHDVPNIIKAKKAIKKAFQTQIDGKGFSLVEILSTCPTNWGLSAEEALTWLKENMIPYYPLGVKKEV